MGRDNTVLIEVRQQILWIGGEAYPVRNIARAQMLSYTPRYGAAIARFVLVTLLALFLAAAGMRSSIAEPLILVGALAFFAVLIHLVVTLTKKKQWALVIETASSSHTALMTYDRSTLHDLVDKIMAAVNEPQVHYIGRLKVSTGDRIKQIGDHNTGKVTR